MITPTNLTPPPPGLSARRPATSANINIETARLSLTPLRAVDAEALRSVFAPEETAVQTHAIRHPFTLEDAQAYIDKAATAPFDLPTLGIRNEEGHLIGVISLSPGGCGKTSLLKNLGPYLSVFIAPAFQKAGYAPEAIEGLFNWVRKNRLHKMLQAAHFADNLPSAEVLTRSGFLYTGRKTQETSLAREGEHLALHMIRLI